MLDVTIIGAGITGTYLSSLLKSQGLEVLIIDKSKSIGGRFCTKPVGGDLADYGCQLIEPKCDLAKKVVQDLMNSQLVIPNMIKRMLMMVILCASLFFRIISIDNTLMIIIRMLIPIQPTIE